jgi:hypothetical protein
MTLLWAFLQYGIALETAQFKALKLAAGAAATHQMQQATETGAWLKAMPNSLNGTDLLADEFKDNLWLCFGQGQPPVVLWALPHLPTLLLQGVQ